MVAPVDPLEARELDVVIVFQRPAPGLCTGVGPHRPCHGRSPFAQRGTAVPRRRYSRLIVKVTSRVCPAFMSTLLGPLYAVSVANAIS